MYLVSLPIHNLQLTLEVNEGQGKKKAFFLAVFDRWGANTRMMIKRKRQRAVPGPD
jgi:hypothetical protein